MGLRRTETKLVALLRRDCFFFMFMFMQSKKTKMILCFVLCW